MKGIFYGIGVGPGDPELLTVKAVSAIEEADIIIAPKTEKKSDSLALSIAEPYLRDTTQIVYQTFPMVKDFAEKEQGAWQDNTQEILAFLEQGKKVAFLTLGDPMLYSTYIYVFRLLKTAGAEVKTIPGIPAFTAIACDKGYPIAMGEEILTIIPATAGEEQIKQALKVTDNAVLMKVYKNFPRLTEILAEDGLAKEAVLVSRAGLAEEKLISDIAAHREEPLNYLSTILTRRKDWLTA